jgi:signal transduction histidine kinase
MMSSIEAPIQIEGDKVLLETVVVNLLENALKYGYEKGSITLRLSQNEKWIELEVENEGPTISASEKRKNLAKVL